MRGRYTATDAVQEVTRGVCRVWARGARGLEDGRPTGRLGASSSSSPRFIDAWEHTPRRRRELRNVVLVRPSTPA